MKPDKSASDSDNYPESVQSSFDGSNRRVANPTSRQNCYEDLVDLDPSDPKALCAPVCGRDLMFQSENKAFAEHWMTVWASLCLVVTAFTVLTCWLDTSRFKFPERPIIYLAACYHVYSWGYILRLILTFEAVACQQLKNEKSHLIIGGLDNPKCVIVQIILYYFSMAASIWWVDVIFTFIQHQHIHKQSYYLRMHISHRHYYKCNACPAQGNTHTEYGRCYMERR